MQNSLKLKKRSGFTLIELLVVVAILGILASVGILSYSGYVQGAKRKSVENLLMQMSLGQTEYYADNNVYHTSHNCSSAGSAVATAKDTTTNALETSLLGGQEIGKDLGYFFCSGPGKLNSNYTLYAAEQDASDGCAISMDSNNKFTRVRKSGADC